MATKTVVSPGKYIQGPGELNRLETYSRDFGAKPFIIADEFVTNMTKDAVKHSYTGQRYLVAEDICNRVILREVSPRELQPFSELFPRLAVRGLN